MDEQENSGLQKWFTGLVSIFKSKPDYADIAKLATGLQKGSKGEQVRKLQHALGVKEDGVYGGKTENALRKAFVEAVFASAKKEQRSSGVPAAITTAQAILESYYGKSVPKDIKTGKYSYNLFGIKAKGDQPSVASWTHEEENGKSVPIIANFVKYDSFKESISGHTSFLTGNKRYSSLFTITDPVQWAHGLQNAHYATDSNYGNKLINVMRQWDLK